MELNKGEGAADNTWHGVPKKRYGETYGQYLRRITPQQEYAISMSARAIHVLPRSLFDSYIPTETDADESGPAEGATNER